ncbi:MAG: hypothetical protein IT305_23520 [Chloroflexi bacterium]|nr:hypothetical protein [Chloroflexota bacterium]
MPDTCEIAVLDFRAVVEGPADLIASLQRMRPAWQASSPSGMAAHLRMSADAGQSARYRIEHDGKLVGRPYRQDEVLAYVDRAINAAAVASLGSRYLLLHAGAIAYQGRGCLLPAASGSGKTTLVAGLIAAGCEYFSDEVAVIDLSSDTLLPFPKPLGVKAGSRQVLSRAFPELRTDLPRRRIDGRAIWLLPPPDRTQPAGPVPVAAVVVPRYVHEGCTRFTQVAPARVFPELLSQVPDLCERDGRNFRALSRVLRSSRCYRLTFGPLETALHRGKNALADLGQ